jgi:hypothetical protein
MVNRPSLNGMFKITSYLQVLTSLVCLFLVLSLGSCGAEDQSVTDYSIQNERGYQDKELIASAWQLPVARTYKNTFVYQENGAFCGPASVVNTFNSLGIEGFNQSSVIDNSSVYYIKARFLGLTLDEMRTVFVDNLKKAGHSNWLVTAFRNLDIDQFRAHLRQANSLDFRYVINFSRLPIFGVDVGHHSPIGGYIESNDSVFVLDVLDDYRPFLVSIEKLFMAMNTIDSETKKKRGLIQLHVQESAL